MTYICKEPKFTWAQIFLFFTLISIIGCSNKVELNNIYDSSILDYELIEDQKTIHLDSSTALFNFHYTFTDYFDTLFIFNALTNDIKWSNVTDNDTIKNLLSIPKEGPNSVGGMDHLYSGFGVNQDSIYLFSHISGVFTIVNDKGEVLTKTKLISDSVGLKYKGYGHQPIKFFNGKIILNSGEILPEKINTNRKFLHLTSSKNPSLDYKIDLPVRYPWHINDYKVSPHHLDYKYTVTENNLVISMPSSDSLIVIDSNLNRKQFLAGSRVVGSLTFETKGNFESSNGYYWSQGAYEEIFYDPFRDLYVRVGRSNVSDEEFEKGGILHPKRTFIFLDSAFRVIGQIPMPDNHNTVYLHFTPQGMYLMKFSGFDTSSEDKIVFSLIKYRDDKNN